MAVISGGGATVGDASTVLLDASSSFDPDDPTAQLSYAWACAPLTPGLQGCAAPSGAPAALGFTASQALRLRGAEGAGNAYNVSLTVTSRRSGETAAAWTVLTFLTGSGPIVRISGLLAAKANPSAKLSLFASVSSLSPGNLTTQWSVVGGPQLNLADPRVALTPLTSQSFVLAPGALAPGATYVFQLSAADSYGRGSASVTVPVSRAPRGAAGDGTLGALSVTPASGAALSTAFQFAASGWADEDGPLSYQYAYLLPGATRPVALSGFRTDYQSAAFQLPAADPVLPATVVVQLLVQNAYGVVSVAPVNVSVTVSWSPGSYSFGSVASKVSDARRLALDGKGEDSLSVVGALSALLNAGIAIASSASGGGSYGQPPGGSSSAPLPPVPPLPGRTQDQAVRAFFRQDLVSVIALVRLRHEKSPLSVH